MIRTLNSKTAGTLGSRTLRMRHRLVDDLGLAILGGEFQPGQSLPSEVRLCEELGVSRTAMREAIRGIVAKGLVESRPKIGTRVRAREHWNHLDPDVLRWQLEVSDTGSGMLRETQARVFDPFFTTKSAGRGLGLAVVQGIVRGLGGTIRLVSNPDHGTTVQILLPCAETASEAVRESMSHISQPARPSNAATVLVVEDEDPLRQAVSKMLRKHGFSVIEVRDGSAALDAIRGRNNTIHVLFLDITLPGASARDVLDEARRLRPEMKVIITSTYPEEMAGVLLERAIERFMRKPYQVYDLVRLIDSIKP